MMDAGETVFYGRNGIALISLFPKDTVNLFCINFWDKDINVL